MYKAPSQAGFHIGSKLLLAEWGKLPLQFTCPAGTSTCPTTLLNKGELHCEDSTQNITFRAGHLVKLLLCLSDCQFLPNSLATCNRASGYVVHCQGFSHGFRNWVPKIGNFKFWGRPIFFKGDNNILRLYKP